ncbi:MAG: hypothetical protein AAF634_17840 [Bacteroidota bacterium]
MRPIKHSSILFILSLLCSCTGDDDQNQSQVFEISGRIDTKDVGYLQTPIVAHLVHNNYLENVRELRLVVFKNGTDDKERYWSIRITGVDLDRIETPYTLGPKEAYMRWRDTDAKMFGDPTCSRSDVICLYGGESGNHYELVISEITNDQIVGSFSGKLNRFTFGPTVVEDSNDFIKVTNGRFRIQYTRKNE